MWRISDMWRILDFLLYARQKFLINALAPNGALALFEIFAGRISCNKCPHNRYLLLQ